MQPVSPDPFNPCWDAKAEKPRYAGHIFQTQQFWYNAIYNVAPPTECAFVIHDPVVLPVGT